MHTKMNFLDLVCKMRGLFRTPKCILLIWCAKIAILLAMNTFIGRHEAFASLSALLEKRTASLVVIKGRRRIGKSRLAEEFSKLFPRAFSFTGLPPDPGVAQPQQQAEFLRQMREQQIPCQAMSDWGDYFYALSQYTQTGRVCIILDEITWMATADPTFLGKLKIAWDRHFKQNPELILIISGSNSAWIEANILSQTGFFGRVSLRLHLAPLALNYCAEFWGAHRNRIAPYEILKVLAVTGGIPRYLEEIQPTQSAEENLYRLCFTSSGILFNEFDDIFKDLFQKRSARYQSIVTSIANGKNTTSEIAKDLGRIKGGDLSLLLDELVQDGFIARDYTWHISTAKISKLASFRLQDNYLRFYLKYILPHKHQIEQQQLMHLPVGWESIIGLQFENLVINNRRLLHKMLSIPPHEIVMSNPYLQTQTKTRQKCQIDYMIQTKFNLLYLCEIKFSKTPIGPGVIDEVQRKLERLVRPKSFSIRPILIHANGVTDALLEQDFFAQIINFSDFLALKPEWDK